jgi:hypothetical protein
MNFKFRAAALPLLLACAAPAAGGDTAAVLSSDSAAYMEAFSAFQAAYGSAIPYYDLSKKNTEVPAGARTVVAFGGRAANQAYAPGVSIVYCMAPGFFAKGTEPGTRTVKISMVPEFRLLFEKLLAIQPGMKRLRIFWMVPDFESYTDEVKAEGARQGVEVTTVKAASADSLPALLRQGLPQMDAFWIPPDPLIISPEILLILREFSWSNGVPFYGSTKGMTREGAAASVGVSFGEMGKAAAAAARLLEAGRPVPAIIFPEKVQITLNSSAARKCSLTFPRAIIEEAGHLFP